MSTHPAGDRLKNASGSYRGCGFSAARSQRYETTSPGILRHKATSHTMELAVSYRGKATHSTFIGVGSFTEPACPVMFAGGRHECSLAPEASLHSDAYRGNIQSAFLQTEDPAHASNATCIHIAAVLQKARAQVSAISQDYEDGVTTAQRTPSCQWTERLGDAAALTEP